MRRLNCNRGSGSCSGALRHLVASGGERMVRLTDGRHNSASPQRERQQSKRQGAAPVTGIAFENDRVGGLHTLDKPARPRLSFGGPVAGDM